MYAELEQTKKCAICSAEKTLDLFYKDKRRKFGRARECKECKKREERESRKTNPERWKAKRRRNGLKENFGITIETYNKMFHEQEGKCAICGIHQSLLSKHLFVDHCHRTNTIRALLCSKCNFLLGNADNSVKILRSATRYVLKFKK